MIKNPAAHRIGEIARIIRHAEKAPLDEIKEFKRTLGVAKMPCPMRRLLWWMGSNIGRQHANYFGTYVVSTVSSCGGELIHPIAATPMLLTYGIIDADGRCTARFIFDHRVMDGVAAARALHRLELILNTVIVEELCATAATPRGPGMECSAAGG
jgi:hypothetical protein